MQVRGCKQAGEQQPSERAPPKRAPGKFPRAEQGRWHLGTVQQVKGCSTSGALGAGAGGASAVQGGGRKRGSVNFVTR